MPSAWPAVILTGLICWMSYTFIGTRMRRHLLSMILTLIPALASAFDAKSPAGPAPITRTSTSVSWVGIAGNKEESRNKWFYIFQGLSGLSLRLNGLDNEFLWRKCLMKAKLRAPEKVCSKPQIRKTIPRVSQAMRSERSHQTTKYMYGHPSSREYSKQRQRASSSFIYRAPW